MGMDQHRPISSKIGVNQQVSGSKLSLRANSGTILLISASEVASFEELETYPSTLFEEKAKNTKIKMRYQFTFKKFI
jgi:hypothetical protein